ncbi:histidine kinase [Lysobacteraceae bacterium NML75-0749]|nr:histidine kinase [Xanthomonadaceae bacterium NML03-0222]PJK02072.1 histidine kinase [Xanthomonadaceae bacterium NML75-0749]PJK04528.1 histidine kinase [Xanthomonadaceae bacterium NML91-0268]
MRQMKQLLEAKANKEVAWIAPEAAVIDALRMMAEKHIGAVLVMDAGKLVGIFSERDYARKVVLLGRASTNTPVSEVMSRQVLCGRLTDSVAHSMQLMTERRIRHLPIVEHKAVVGLVSIGDLVKAVIEDQQQELRHLQDYIYG